MLPRIDLPNQQTRKAGGLLLDHLHDFVYGEGLERRSAHLAWGRHESQPQDQLIVGGLYDFDSVVLTKCKIASDRPATGFLKLFENLSSRFSTLLDVPLPAFEQVQQNNVIGHRGEI